MRLPHNNFLTQCSICALTSGLSFSIASPTFAADRITLHINENDFVVTIAQLEDYARTGDLSSLSPEVTLAYPFLPFQLQQALHKLPQQLKRPISIRPGQIDSNDQELFDFLIPDTTPEQQQNAYALMAEKSNNTTVLEFLKKLPGETLTKENFVPILTAYTPAKNATSSENNNSSLPAAVPFKSNNKTTSLLSTSTGQIGTIDPSTGIFTPLINSPSFSDIALSNEGKLFGVEPSRGDFYEIDIKTGVSLRIGNSKYMGGLGFSDHNVLYGVGNGLYTIDPLNGDFSLISKIPYSIGDGDIVFDSDNNRFLATPSVSPNKLFSLDLNGNFAEIGDIGFGSVWGLFFQDGTLFGYTGDRKQIIINPKTGAGTFDKNVIGVNGDIWGAASLPSTGSRTSVPEPTSTLGLFAFGAFGAGSLRKRKQQKV